MHLVITALYHVYQRSFENRIRASVDGEAAFKTITYKKYTFMEQNSVHLNLTRGTTWPLGWDQRERIKKNMIKRSLERYFFNFAFALALPPQLKIFYKGEVFEKLTGAQIRFTQWLITILKVDEHVCCFILYSYMWKVKRWNGIESSVETLLLILKGPWAMLLNPRSILRRLRIRETLEKSGVLEIRKIENCPYVVIPRMSLSGGGNNLGACITQKK